MYIDENTVMKIVNKTMESLCENNTQKRDMTLELARKISSRVLEEAKKIGVNAVCAVCNRAARPVLTECADDSFVASFDIAQNKAYTSAALKMHTKDLKKLAQPGGELYGIQNTNDGKIVIFGGGNVLKIGEDTVGAVGVSGGNEQQDTYLGDYAQRVFAEEI